jgi:hypothetical protein
MKQTPLSDRAEGHAREAMKRIDPDRKQASTTIDLVRVGEALVHAVLALACQVADGRGQGRARFIDGAWECCGHMWRPGVRCTLCWKDEAGREGGTL